MNKHRLVYMATTNDAYETPCIVGTADEVAIFTESKANSVRRTASRGGTLNNYKIYCLTNIFDD